MQEQGRLQRLGHHVGPEDDLIEPVPGAVGVDLAGVLERVEREGDQAEEVKVSGARRPPAAEQDIEADDQVDKPDDSQALGQAPVRRLGVDLHGRVERNAGAGDCVVSLPIDPGAIKRAFQIGQLQGGGVVDFTLQPARLDAARLTRICRLHPVFGLSIFGEQGLGLDVGALGRTHRQHLYPGEEVMLLNTGPLAGHVRKHFLRLQPARNLAPPDPIVGLLEMVLLAEIQDRKHEEAGRGHDQQCRLQAVEEAALHGGLLLHPSDVCC